MKRDINFDPRMDDPDYPEDNECPECRGKGTYKENPTPNLPGAYYVYYECDACEGKGYIEENLDEQGDI